MRHCRQTRRRVSVFKNKCLEYMAQIDPAVYINHTIFGNFSGSFYCDLAKNTKHFGMFIEYNSHQCIDWVFGRSA